MICLRKWREEQNLSQDVIADRLGVSQMAVSRWEKGVVPGTAALITIIRFTRGAVTPNDWFTAALAGAVQKEVSRHGIKAEGRRRFKKAKSCKKGRR
jgi:transcriptional regulator with XRE-family HTH domain